MQARAEAGEAAWDSASSPSLRIALLGYRSAPFGGGQGIYLKYLSKALVEAGHQVDVISGEPYPHLDERVRLIKLPGLNLYENGLGSLRPRHLRSWANIVEWLSKLSGGFAEPYSFGRRVNRYLRRHGHRYDLIHDNQCLAWGMLKIQRRLPLVTTIHHPITRDLEIALAAAASDGERWLIRRWHRFLKMQTQVTRRLQHVVTVSDVSCHDIAEAFGRPVERIERIYNGIDTEVFRPLPEIPRDPWQVMATASADQPLKGLRYLLEALAQVATTHPQVKLLLVGKPKPGGETEQLIERLQLAPRMTFVHGISTEALVEHYARSALAVVPSVYEGFGLPAGEAMACGLPVISSQGGALPEVVGDAGLLVPVKDSAALAQAMRQLLDDAALRQRLGAAARARIETHFCWKVAAQAMTAFYRQVLADGNR